MLFGVERRLSIACEIASCPRESNIGSLGYEEFRGIYSVIGTLNLMSALLSVGVHSRSDKSGRHAGNCQAVKQRIRDPQRHSEHVQKIKRSLFLRCH